jgi:multimeric flavodoxin WrbA
MHILILVAGTNHPSNSEVLARAFIEGIGEFAPTSTTNIIRLDKLKIDHFTIAHYDSSTDQGGDFNLIKDEILKADGVVIASPVWNFGVPAHLKNLVDRMGAFALDETHSVGTLKGKPFYFVYTGGMPATGWPLTKRTTSFMDVGLQYFGATIIGHHYEGRCTAGKGIFKEVVSGRQDSLKTVKEKGKKFAEVVEIYATEGTLPMKQSIAKWVFEMGGKMKKKMGL